MKLKTSLVFQREKYDCQKKIAKILFVFLTSLILKKILERIKL